MINLLCVAGVFSEARVLLDDASTSRGETSAGQPDDTPAV